MAIAVWLDSAQGGWTELGRKVLEKEGDGTPALSGEAHMLDKHTDVQKGPSTRWTQRWDCLNVGQEGPREPGKVSLGRNFPSEKKVWESKQDPQSELGRWRSG